MKIFRSTVCVLFIIVFTVCGSDLTFGSQNGVDRESLEKFLQNADIVSIDKERGRRTVSWEIELMEDGVQRKGFFKLTDRPRPHPSGGDSYKYVIAAYELDKMLELNLVPTTVERKIKKEKGSLMLYIDPPVINEGDRFQKNLTPPDPEKFKSEMAAVNVFEHLIFFPCLCNQTDTDNILIQTDNEWKVWMIDLSTAFAPATRLIRDCPLSCCPKELFEQLIDLDENAVKTRLKTYLTDEELNAMLVRKDLIIERIRELIEEKGEEAVLLVKKIK
jgi:hypothetical protein